MNYLHSFVQQNQKFLETYDSELLQELAACGHSSALMIPAKKRGETLSYQGEFVHSKYDPIKEAQRVSLGEPEILHIHYGFGLGYFLDWDTCLEDGCIIIYEPNREILKAALAYRDLKVLLPPKNAFICCSLERLKDMLLKHMKGEQAHKIIVNGYQPNKLLGILVNLIPLCINIEKNTEWQSICPKNTMQMILKTNKRAIVPKAYFG